MRALPLVFLVPLTAITTVNASPISDKYSALGGKSGFLGDKTGAELPTGDGGKYQTFQHGVIYWHDSAHGAFVVYGLILQRYLALGGPAGEFGYPVTDEMDMYDKWGRVSKFQRGELVYRPSTNAVTEVRISDTQVDLPTPPGEIWQVKQTYNGISHGGPWVYCYDFYAAQGSSQGKPIPSSADANIIAFEDTHNSGPNEEGNVVIQRLGKARYASSLHIVKGSYWKYAPKNMIWLGWPGYPVKSGTTIAETGDTGTNLNNFHTHYCVTTEPDRNIFKPFESVPVSFRNFEVSKDGQSWKTIGAGVPMTGDYVRRKWSVSGGAASVNNSAEPVNFGSVEGQVLLPPGFKAANGGKVTVSVVAPWGEPIVGTTYAIITGINDAGPVKFKFNKVTDYKGMKIVASLDGTVSPANYALAGESGVFNVAPAQTQTVNLTMKATKGVE